MVLNKQISHPIQSRQPGKTMQNTTTKRKIHRKPVVKCKGIQTNQDKTIIILIFTWKRNKHTQITQFARQKDRGCLRQLYEAIIPIWWKQLSWTCNNPASIKTTLPIVMKTTHQSRTIKPNHQAYNSSQQQQEYKETGTTKVTNTSTKVEWRLTSQ